MQGDAEEQVCNCNEYCHFELAEDPSDKSSLKRGGVEELKEQDDYLEYQTDILNTVNQINNAVVCVTNIFTI